MCDLMGFRLCCCDDRRSFLKFLSPKIVSKRQFNIIYNCYIICGHITLYEFVVAGVLFKTSLLTFFSQFSGKLR